MALVPNAFKFQNNIIPDTQWVRTMNAKVIDNENIVEFSGNKYIRQPPGWIYANNLFFVGNAFHFMTIKPSIGLK